MIDVLSAQSALTTTRVQLALAEFDRQTALIQYHLALGDTPDPTKDAPSGRQTLTQGRSTL
jgi:outer membrane protein TolC